MCILYIWVHLYDHYFDLYVLYVCNFWCVSLTSINSTPFCHACCLFICRIHVDYNGCNFFSSTIYFKCQKVPTDARGVLRLCSGRIMTGFQVSCIIMEPWLLLSFFEITFSVVEMPKFLLFCLWSWKMKIRDWKFLVYFAEMMSVKISVIIIITYVWCLDYSAFGLIIIIIKCTFI